MVRVISAHHFEAQDVFTLPEPVCSAVAENFLLTASHLHQVEVHNLEVTTEKHVFPTIDLVKQMVYSPVGRYLATLERRDEASFVRVYMNWWSEAAVGQPMRARIAGQVTPGWTSDDPTCLEMLEIPLHTVLHPDARRFPHASVSCISVCPSTGNLLITSGNHLTILRFTLSCGRGLSTTSLTSSHRSRYIDLEACLHVSLGYEPREVKLVEDLVACLTTSDCHVFKIRLEDSTSESQDPLLSLYSITSGASSISSGDQDSHCASMDSSPDQVGPHRPLDGVTMGQVASGPHSMAPTVPGLVNLTERRRLDSGLYTDVFKSQRKHAQHITLGGREPDADDEDEGHGASDSKVIFVPNPAVETWERDQAMGGGGNSGGNLATPRLLEELTYSPANASLPELNIGTTVTMIASAFPSTYGSLKGVAVTMLLARLGSVERASECLAHLRVEPVYWREYRVRRPRGQPTPREGVTSPTSVRDGVTSPVAGREGGVTSPTGVTSPGGTISNNSHSPLQSAMYSHLMSITLIFASTHEGYLYHIPGHIRRIGKGVGVQRIATYPFTSPIIDLVVEPTLLHALTVTGLETYTLRSGYHTVREAQTMDHRTNTCPPTTTPICLIGIRPFFGVHKLLISSKRLVILATPNSDKQTPPNSIVDVESEAESEWTVYSLHLPPPLHLYRDMLTVADINKAVPHGYLQLLSEAHMVVRTWLHRLSWLQVMKVHGEEVAKEELDAVKQTYQESCIRLADHYVEYQTPAKYSLAVPYYRMGQLTPMAVLEKFKISEPIQPGIVHYIEELVLRPAEKENLLDPGVIDKIICLLGSHSLNTLVKLVLNSSTFRSFKSKQSLDHLKQELSTKSGRVRSSSDGMLLAQLTLAVVLVGGAGSHLTSVPPVQLAATVLNYHQLLFEAENQNVTGFSELAITLKENVPVVFVEICVSLIQSGVCSLGQMLQLLLQTFMSGANSPSGASNNAYILQFFLETYFVELASKNDSIQAVLPLSADQQQAVLTLVRSYLAGLLPSFTWGDASIMDNTVTLLPDPGELFGSRSEYLDFLPPFPELADDDDCEDLSVGLISLLKLQSLFCSGLCDNNCKEVLARFADDHQDVQGHSSLLVMAAVNHKTAIQLLAKKFPLSLSYYCKSESGKEEVWKEAIASLAKQKSQECQQALDTLVSDLVTENILAPEELIRILPPIDKPDQAEDKYQDFILQAQKLQQAKKLQGLIVNTGYKLLTTLSL